MWWAEPGNKCLCMKPTLPHKAFLKQNASSPLAAASEKFQYFFRLQSSCSLWLMANYYFTCNELFCFSENSSYLKTWHSTVHMRYIEQAKRFIPIQDFHHKKCEWYLTNTSLLCSLKASSLHYTGPISPISRVLGWNFSGRQKYFYDNWSSCHHHFASTKQKYC